MTELELKLVWLGEPPDLGAPDRVLALTNQYFDTSDSQLAAQGYGLRLRQNDDAIEQTLKGPAPDQDGVRVRREWNWPRTTFQVDPSVLPVQVKGPLIETSFNQVQRQLWSVEGVERVMDQGQVRVGTRTSQIAEIELEDKGAGWRAVLLQALSLAEQFPCFIGSISKAERGRVLAGDGFAPDGSDLDALGRALDPLSGPDWDKAQRAAQSLGDAVVQRIERRDANVAAIILRSLLAQPAS